VGWLRRDHGTTSFEHMEISGTKPRIAIPYSGGNIVLHFESISPETAEIAVETDSSTTPFHADILSWGDAWRGPLREMLEKIVAQQLPGIEIKKFEGNNHTSNTLNHLAWMDLWDLNEVKQQHRYLYWLGEHLKRRRGIYIDYLRVGPERVASLIDRGFDAKSVGLFTRFNGDVFDIFDFDLAVQRGYVSRSETRQRENDKKFSPPNKNRLRKQSETGTRGPLAVSPEVLNRKAFNAPAEKAVEVTPGMTLRKGDIVFSSDKEAVTVFKITKIDTWSKVTMQRHFGEAVPDRTVVLLTAWDTDLNQATATADWVNRASLDGFNVIRSETRSGQPDEKVRYAMLPVGASEGELLRAMYPNNPFTGKPWDAPKESVPTATADGKTEPASDILPERTEGERSELRQDVRVDTENGILFNNPVDSNNRIGFKTRSFMNSGKNIANLTFVNADQGDLQLIEGEEITVPGTGIRLLAKSIQPSNGTLDLEIISNGFEVVPANDIDTILKRQPYKAPAVDPASLRVVQPWGRSEARSDMRGDTSRERQFRARQLDNMRRQDNATARDNRQKAARGISQKTYGLPNSWLRTPDRPKRSEQRASLLGSRRGRAVAEEA
jgi:hypothetical protein